MLLFADPIRVSYASCLPIVDLERVQLSNCICLLYWRSCYYVLFLILQFLQTCLHKGK